MKRVAGLCLALAASPAFADATLLAEETRGALEPYDEHTLRIEGVRGEIAVRPADTEMLRFASMSPGERGEDPPLALWSEGGRLILRAPEGESARPRTLWVAVPDGLSVEIAVDQSKVVVAGLEGRLDVEGRALDLSTSRIADDVVVRMEGGTAKLQGGGGNLSLEARDAAVTVSGPAGSLDAEVEESTLEIRNCSEVVRVEAEGGTVTIREARGGAELQLRGASLTLESVGGIVRIETDGDVTLADNTAQLRLESWGGSIDGARFDGALDLKLEGGVAKLATLAAASRIEANDAEVDVVNVAEPLEVVLWGSRLGVTNAGGPLKIEAEGGAVTVADPKSTVEITARNADVAVSGAKGAVQVVADSANVTVAWTSLPPEANSRIVNSGGDVTVSIPAGQGCWLTGRARRGWIESQHPEIRIGDDGSQASGSIGRRRRPTLDLDAEGSLYILSGTRAR